MERRATCSFGMKGFLPKMQTGNLLGFCWLVGFFVYVFLFVCFLRKALHTGKASFTDHVLIRSHAWWKLRCCHFEILSHS